MALSLNSAIPFFHEKVRGFNDKGELVTEQTGLCWPVSFDFASIASPYRMKVGLFDLGIKYLQTVYIDNSTANDCSFEFGSSRQVITAKTKTQGYYPVLGNPLDLDLTVTCAGAVKINTLWINERIAPLVWSVT